MTTFTIDRNRFSEKGKELYDLLKKIMSDENDIIFVMALAKGDKNRQIVIDFIKNQSKKPNDIINFVDNKF